MPEQFDVVIPRAVQREVEALAGRSAGYAVVRQQLGDDPCQPELGAYRLSGPLEPHVCGVRLKNEYRLAFTMQPPPAANDDPRTRVVILYVGKREPGHRSPSDVWDVLHEVFGVENPPAGHTKPPCCHDGLPMIDDTELEAFVASLRRFSGV